MPDTMRDRIAQKFTHVELNRLRDMRARIAAALPVCDDAEACGANVEGPRQALQLMDTQFQEIETRFMPSAASDPNNGQ